MVNIGLNTRKTPFVSRKSVTRGVISLLTIDTHL